MNIDTVSISLRVFITCLVFAVFVFVPFKSRFRCGYLKTALLVLLLILITVTVTLLFLCHGKFLSEYNAIAILFWIVAAVAIFRLTVRGSYLELLFIVLVVLNLYVNIMTIAKLLVNAMNLSLPYEAIRALFSVLVLAAYTPLLWLLMFKLYRRVIELDISRSFWRLIWVIPALTYLIFYVKIVGDYWRGQNRAGTGDVVFIILWSFATYMFFGVTLQMVILACEGVTAKSQAKFAASQLQLQEGQYGELLAHIESTARLRHDWRHHLLTLCGFAERGQTEELKSYLEELIPEYAAEAERPVCRNHAVDVILRHYAGVARKSGVQMEICTDIHSLPAVSDTELCIIFGNLVENAVEACACQGEGDKEIRIRAEMKGDQLVLMVRNTYRNPILVRDEVYFSTKHEGAGIGLASVKRVVEKHGGIMKVDLVRNYFTVYAIMNTI